MNHRLKKLKEKDSLNKFDINKPRSLNYYTQMKLRKSSSVNHMAIQEKNINLYTGSDKFFE